MKIEELRIGNLVMIGVHVRTIRGIHTQKHFTQADQEHVYINDFPNKDVPYYAVDLYQLSPIPLTEEWLLRFGFETDQHRYWWDARAVSLYLFLTDRNEVLPEMWRSDEDYSGISLNPIQYVHQLQNLYFALTGEELDLNHQRHR